MNFLKQKIFRRYDNVKNGLNVVAFCILKIDTWILNDAYFCDILELLCLFRWLNLSCWLEFFFRILMEFLTWFFNGVFMFDKEWCFFYQISGYWHHFYSWLASHIVLQVLISRSNSFIKIAHYQQQQHNLLTKSQQGLPKVDYRKPYTFHCCFHCCWNQLGTLLVGSEKCVFLQIPLVIALFFS